MSHQCPSAVLGLHDDQYRDLYNHSSVEHTKNSMLQRLENMIQEPKNTKPLDSAQMMRTSLGVKCFKAAIDLIEKEAGSKWVEMFVLKVDGLQANVEKNEYNVKLSAVSPTGVLNHDTDYENDASNQKGLIVSELFVSLTLNPTSNKHLVVLSYLKTVAFAQKLGLGTILCACALLAAQILTFYLPSHHAGMARVQFSARASNLGTLCIYEKIFTGFFGNCLLRSIKRQQNRQAIDQENEFSALLEQDSSEHTLHNCSFVIWHWLHKYSFMFTQPFAKTMQNLHDEHARLQSQISNATAELHHYRPKFELLESVWFQHGTLLLAKITSSHVGMTGGVVLRAYGVQVNVHGHEVLFHEVPEHMLHKLESQALHPAMRSTGHLLAQ